MKVLYIITAIIFMMPGISAAQSLKGKVVTENNKPLAGASVHWLDLPNGTITDSLGIFELQFSKNTVKKLVVSYVGYRSDTIAINNEEAVEIRLAEGKQLGEVIVTGKRPGIYISEISPIKTEVITKVELKKAACCDLAGCFETQASVQPQTTNVITNSKELRILGLSGVYNQVLIDGMPMIQGLSYTYGISSIPGTLVDNIYISKGANSVIQGFESISGQINVETKEPDNTDKLLLNLYANSFLEKHLNANYSFKYKKWSSLAAFHTVQPANRIDRDNDKFMDLPLLTRYMISNKWKYGNDRDWGWSSRIGIRYLNEQRIGGQTNFNINTDKGTTNAYGQTVNIQQPELWTKTSYRFNDKHKITFIGSSFYQNQHSFFGTTKYSASQTNIYANLQYELLYKEKHILKTGISYRHLSLNEDISFTANPLNRTFAGRYQRIENIPGIFAENTFNWKGDKLVWITGIRADFHNQFGTYITPRTLLKYEIKENSTFRASVGTGWRTVNLFSENVGLLASSRDIVFTEQLKPEKAINFGANFTQKFDSKNIEGYISIDYYRTQFQNQIFPDYDASPSKAIISNFTGKSISDGFQVEAYSKFFSRFEAKAAYVYLDVYRKVNGRKFVLPFNPAHKILSTLSYKPLTSKWHLDVNIHWYGVQQLPNTSANPPEFQRPQKSKPFTLVNAQFTKTWKQFEVYAGCENIFDFRQQRPIISWQNPFSPYFDTSSVWGPTRGRELYLGVRFMIK
ncbi:MAG: TonB-dependent receptor [Hydrotalea sp. AMD]|nr:MAG: TonB-dependent receptor [Sphingobacteriales bacterium]RWZ86222.1 MAG: TonB-dependent receptor [Hydrotalea sp. AMD]